MAKQQERSKETESALISAAMKICRDKDASKTTIREICAEAGVSIGAFYHHFESKQDLIAAAYKSFDLELNRLMSIRCQHEDPLTALRNLLTFQITYVSHQSVGSLVTYYCTTLNDSSRASVSPDRTYYRYTYDCVRRMADAGMLRPDCDPYKTAEMCICFVRGCLIDWTLHNQDYDVVEYVKFALPILLRGFLNPEIEV